MASAIPEVIEVFDAALPADARVQRRTMFGCPCAFVNGNLFFGTFGDGLMIRLPEDLRAAAVATVPGAGPFVPSEGRPMREYVSLPGDIAMGALKDQVALSFAWILTLPPKVKKAPAEKKPPKPRAAPQKR